MHFEIESDKDVLLDTIGLLEAGEPHVVTEFEHHLFEVHHGVKLTDANFADGVVVTAVMDNEEGGSK